MIKKVMRMSNNIYAGLVALIICWSVSPFNLYGIVAFIVVFCYTAGGNTLNEFFDRKTYIEKNMVLKYALFFFTTGSVFLIIIPIYASIIALFVMLLLLIYDIKFSLISKHLNLKNCIVALSTALVPIFALTVVEGYNYISGAIIISVILFGWQFYRERWKDIDEGITR